MHKHSPVEHHAGMCSQTSHSRICTACYYAAELPGGPLVWATVGHAPSHDRVTKFLRGPILCRRVFKPFSWELRRFTAMPDDAAVPVPGTPRDADARRSSSGFSALPEAAGEEVRSH